MNDPRWRERGDEACGPDVCKVTARCRSGLDPNPRRQRPHLVTPERGIPSRSVFLAPPPRFVVSILIALQVDNWNEARRQEERVRAVLRGVRTVRSTTARSTAT